MLNFLHYMNPAERLDTRPVDHGVIRPEGLGDTDDILGYAQDIRKMQGASWGRALQESVMPGVQEMGKYLAEDDPAIELGLQDQASNIPMGMVAGIFGGRLAKTFPEHILSDAGALLSKGADPEQIRKLTGLFKTADNRIRYEIDDSAARFLRPWKELPKKSNLTLGDVLYHPDLFEAYPHLKNMPIGNDMGFSFALGSFDPAKKRIDMQPFLEDDRALGTLMHEIQHAVQDIENFARGAGQSSFEYLTRGENRAALHDYLTDIFENSYNKFTKKKAAQALDQLDTWISTGGNQRYAEAYDNYTTVDNQIKQLIDARKELVEKFRTLKSTPQKTAVRKEIFALNNKYDELYEIRKGFQSDLDAIHDSFSDLGNMIYKNSAGEHEANEVIDRLKYSKQERREIRPGYLDLKHFLINY